MWHDIEVVSYVQTAPGVFRDGPCRWRGAGASCRRSCFPPPPFLRPQHFSRMPRTQVDAGSADAEGDALVVTLGPTAGTGGC
jgi:hypothetical protein